MNYASECMKWLKNPENVGDLLRYGAIGLGALYGGKEWLETQDAIAATHALQPAAIMFTAGEALRAYDAFRKNGLNALQAVGRSLSVAFPALAAYSLGDNTYNPITDLGGPIAGWGLAQGITAIGDKKQEQKLGEEVVSQGREQALEFIGKNADDETLREYIGKLRTKME
ncbi:MAG: hypothetical protein AABX14_05215 [Candidatus Aenigmatarchaeota archaeon]